MTPFIRRHPADDMLPCDTRHITIGSQCGGSDGYSGIRAKPAPGAAVDQLVARIKWCEHYTAINGGEMNNNPSPGNKAGKHGFGILKHPATTRSPTVPARRPRHPIPVDCSP